MVTSHAARIVAGFLAFVFWGWSAPRVDAAADTSAGVLFGRAPALSLVTLSPSGTSLAYLAQSDDRQAIILRTLRDGREQKTLDVESGHERIAWCRWAEPRFLLCGTIVPRRAPQGILEHTRLYAIENPSGRVNELNVRLTDPRRDQIVGFASSRAGHVLLQHDEIGRGYPEVSELDLATGNRRRVVNDLPPVRRWMSDGLGNVILGVGYDRGIATLHVPSSGDQGWEVAAQYSIDDLEAMGPLAFGVSQDQLYVLKNHEGRTALFRVDLQTRSAPELLFADPRYDVAGPLVLDPASKSLLAVRYVTQQEQAHFFDLEEAERQAWLDTQLPGNVNLVVDRTADGHLLLVQSARDVDPPSYYLVDVERRELALVGHQYPELEALTLAPMNPVTYGARDGQAIPAYLTLPPGRPAKELPAVVLPHGGPESRDYLRFDPLVQFLALQGYAVLQMNFRGSVGYGARYAAAGAGQWGGVVHNDITDGARWLVSEGIADATRVCIVGSSFGGYAAMLGATRESQWYACAVSYAGISDLLALAASTERSAEAQLWRERLGEDRLALWQMSPLSRVQGAETPLLLIHGRMDAVVPDRQSVRLARELRQEGKEAALEQRSDCDHDMTIQACRLFFFARLEQFLSEHLE